MDHSQFRPDARTPLVEVVRRGFRRRLDSARRQEEIMQAIIERRE